MGKSKFRNRALSILRLSTACVRLTKAGKQEQDEKTLSPDMGCQRQTTIRTFLMTKQRMTDQAADQAVD